MRQRHKQLLSATASAKHLGIAPTRFKNICDAGQGPRVWNPDGGRPMYARAALDEWLAERDDQQQRVAS